MQITSGSSFYEPVLLGIDLGTAGVRVLAVSGKGEVLAVGEAAYPQESIKVDGGNHEQDPEAWWQAVLSAVRGLVRCAAR